MSTPTWLPIAISGAGTIIALSAFAYQIHRARFNQSVALLFCLENDFFGSAKRGQRVKASHDLLAGRVLEAEPILDFFETMALLLRRGALDEEMVQHTFFYWIDGYTSAASAAIALRQQTDPLVWKDLVAMAAKLRRAKAQELRVNAVSRLSIGQIESFLIEEQTETS